MGVRPPITFMCTTEKPSSFALYIPAPFFASGHIIAHTKVASEAVGKEVGRGERGVFADSSALFVAPRVIVSALLEVILDHLPFASEEPVDGVRDDLEVEEIVAHWGLEPHDIHARADLVVLAAERDVHDRLVGHGDRHRFRQQVLQPRVAKELVKLRLGLRLVRVRSSVQGLLGALDGEYMSMFVTRCPLNGAMYLRACGWRR